jgi:4-oxalocrotonate tautomerase
MPFVTVQVTREGTAPGIDHVTAEQKAAIFKGMTQVLFEVLGKTADRTWVVLQEIEPENWGWGGMPLLAYRRQLGAEKEGKRHSGTHDDAS